MEIDKNIPLPPPRRKYPIQSMEVGDSILIPSRSHVEDGLRRFKNMGWKFATRKEGDNSRLWRIK